MGIASKSMNASYQGEPDNVLNDVPTNTHMYVPVCF